VQPAWRICPACETRLQAPTCPLCRQLVKENWKRCPECEALLICGTCRRRLPRDSQQCPYCDAVAGQSLQEKISGSPALQFNDTVCGLEMIYVPGGTFQMGDTFGQGTEDEQPVHDVTLEGFYLGRYVVTQSQWLRLMPENPSKFEGDQRPVEQVTWDEARRFAQMLTEAHQGRYAFDLPSEAQWEYAARSGGKQELYAGGDLIAGLAWYAENSKGHTHDVGEKAPNGHGLFDMSGNVWEWCRDTFTPDAYSNHSAGPNPLFEDRLLDDRVIRGGSWHPHAWSARCARRFSCTHDFRGAGLGFRLLLIPNRSSCPVVRLF
jgi:formylglycine-generating enzyme required for sulfatase activity